MSDVVIDVSALEARISALELEVEELKAAKPAPEAAPTPAALEPASARISRIEAYLRTTSHGLYTGGAGE